jgi:glyoxylase-like metal-dependent hydrolase (beta-lactamase superfamily II)
MIHSRTYRHWGWGAALVLAAGATAFAQADKDLSDISYAKARQVLDAAIAAQGGRDALQSLKDVWRKGSGIAYNQGQSLRPDPPYTTRPVEQVSVVDFANRRSQSETATTPQGGVPGKARAVLAGDAGFGLNLVTNVVTPATAGGVTGLRTALRRDPASVLLTAAGRAETLRFLGEETYAGAPHKVITFADADGTQVSLFIDAATSLLSKYETLADNPVLGDARTEVVFLDYRPVGGVKLPFKVVNRTAGEVTQEILYSDVRVNTQPAAALFDTPADSVKAAPAGPPGTVSIRKLAEDVYLAEGSSHNSLFVVFADHVLLVEAPLGDERVQAVMAKIKETAPGKPVKYVVLTHHHYDHTGGLRAAIASGATIVTTAGNKAFVERVASTPHTIRPDALSREPKAPVVETFTRKRVFTDGNHTVELHDIGPSPHVQEAVIAYLPKEKIAFQCDLIGLPADGPLPPASPATQDFVQKVKALGLNVETITGGHGRIGTMDEVARAAGAGGTR